MGFLSMECPIKAKKREYDREYRLRNLEKRRAQQRAWNADPKNKEHKKQYDLIYREVNREKKNAQQLKKKKTDPIFKLKCNLRNRLLTAIKRNAKKGSAVRDLGCSTEFFKSYMESKFQPGMSWENWSRTGWHIDHIIPLSAFDLQDVEQFKKAVHYTNLQPLWSRDNLRKSNKVA